MFQNKKGGIGMVLVDVFAILLIILMFIIFNILFRLTVEKRAESIKGVVFDVDRERALISILRTEFRNETVNDYIVEFCGNDAGISEMAEYLKNQKTTIKIYVVCPDGKSLFLGESCEPSIDKIITENIISNPSYNGEKEKLIFGIDPARPIKIRAFRIADECKRMQEQIAGRYRQVYRMP